MDFISIDFNDLRRLSAIALARQVDMHLSAPRWKPLRAFYERQNWRAKVSLTRAWTRLVASISAVVDNVADFVEGDTVPVGALKLALPAGKHRGRREDAGANEPMHVWNIIKVTKFSGKPLHKWL